LFVYEEIVMNSMRRFALRKRKISRITKLWAVPHGAGGAGKVNYRNPVAHADEKSDTPILPVNSTNKGGNPAEADGVTWQEYESALPKRLPALPRKIHTGA